MSQPPEIRWEMFLPDGQRVCGHGQDAPAGMKLATIAADAVAARFMHPAGTVVYVAGKISLIWTIQNVLSCTPEAESYMQKHSIGPTSKALGLTPLGEQLKVWIMPNGEIGIGRSVEEVGMAWRAFNVARKV